MLLDDDNKLICPSCGGDSLHQIKVDVFERDEDEKKVLHAQVGKSKIVKSIVVSNYISGNPSLRRQGLTISFSCETCEYEPKLDFAQHKGVTLVTWREYM